MFSDNQKISMRQTFRLFSYDLIGLSTLLLPTFLAKYAGRDGVFAILIGTLATLAYLIYLGFILGRMKKDMLTFCKEEVPVFIEKLVFIWLLFQAVIVAGYTAFVFANLMKRSLLREESFWLVLLVILAIAGYGIIGGMEGRARIYEVLFWFIMIPLILMTASAVKEVDTDYWTPIFTGSPWITLKAGYLVFIFFGTVSWVLLLSGYVKAEDRKRKLIRCVKKAVIFAAVVLVILYFILLGTFGSKAMASIDYPAVTFMSTVQITGRFLKRADALMQGVWFFTLFALLNTNLFYGMTVLKEVVEIKGKKRYMLILLAMTFGVAAVFYLAKECVSMFYGYWWYIGMPLLIVVPGLLVLCKSRAGRRNNLFTIVLFSLVACNLTGCSTTELEDRCFPMLAAVEQNKDDGQIEVSYLYQPLEQVSDEMTNLSGIDTFVAGSEDFYKAWHNYEKGLNKVVDYNHLKIIILGSQLLENKEQLSEMLQVLEKEENFPRNTYVCVTDNVSEMLGINEKLPSNIGTYLEELLENNKYVDADGLPTLGNLFEEKENQLETLFLPYFSVEKDLPVLQGYYCMQRGEPMEVVPVGTAYLGFLESRNLKEYVLELEDGSFLKLSAFQTSYDLSTQGRVTVNVSCEGKMNYGSQPSNKVVSKYVSEYFTDLALRELHQKRIDISNSYKKIGGYNRDWYLAWKEQIESGANPDMKYEDNLTIQYHVDVVMTSEKVT